MRWRNLLLLAIPAVPALLQTAMPQTELPRSAMPPTPAQTTPAPISTQAIDRLLDRIIEREKSLLDTMRTATPIVETYIQETPDDASDPLNPEGHPVRDHYFLGRFSVPGKVIYQPLLERTSAPTAPRKNSLSRILPQSRRATPSEAARPPMVFLPRGFAQMAIPDVTSFDRENYSFEYVRREFLGEVRCLVFDVAPRPRNQPGRFVG